MQIGYARTSTADQAAGLAAQERDLKSAGAKRLFSEQISSVVSQRPQLEAALGFAREGDVLVVTKPDRLARSTTDLLSLAQRLEGRGVALVVLSMGGQTVDTRTATGKLMLTMLGAIGAFERDLMLERQREGIAKAKAEGRYLGRQPTVRRQTATILRMKADGMGPSAIARQLGVDRSSVHRILVAEKGRGQGDAGAEVISCPRSPVEEVG